MLMSSNKMVWKMVFKVRNGCDNYEILVWIPWCLGLGLSNDVILQVKTVAEPRLVVHPPQKVDQTLIVHPRSFNTFYWYSCNVLHSGARRGNINHMTEYCTTTCTASMSWLTGSVWSLDTFGRADLSNGLPPSNFQIFASFVHSALW